MAGWGSGAAPPNSCDSEETWATIDAAICKAKTNSRMPIPRARPTRTSIGGRAQGAGNLGQAVGNRRCDDGGEGQRQNQTHPLGHRLFAKGRHQE